MNIKKLTVFLEKLLMGGIVFSMVMAPPSLEARSRKGAYLRIEKKDGVKVEGELLKVSGETLLLFEKYSGRDSQVDLKDVKTLGVRRSHNTLAGLFGGLGLAIGASCLATKVFKPRNSCSCEDIGRLICYMIISTPIFMVLGVATNGFMGKFAKHRVDGLADEKWLALLDELDGMSRQTRAAHR
jgi:hypothetical protein